MLKDMYVVDLESKRIEVELYTKDVISDDLEFFGATLVSELCDNDWRVFDTEESANEFVSAYQHALKNLERLKSFEKNGAKPMLMKRRYIVLAALGLKLSTRRSYKNAWKPGTLFYIHDQTHALLVKLKSIKTLDDCYQYHYTLA